MTPAHKEPFVNPDSKLLVALGRSYKTLEQIRVSTESALNAHLNYPVLEGLVNKLRAADHQMRELLLSSLQ